MAKENKELLENVAKEVYKAILSEFEIFGFRKHENFEEIDLESRYMYQQLRRIIVEGKDYKQPK